MNRTCGLRCQSARSCRHHKGCRFIQTAGRWSWKSKSAKKCVTTYLPNELALKIDGAETNNFYFTVVKKKKKTFNNKKYLYKIIIILIYNIFYIFIYCKTGNRYNNIMIHNKNDLNL